MTKSLSGTSDTSHLSDPGSDRGCPCGRSHPTHGTFKRPSTVGPAFHGRAVDRVYDAVIAGKGDADAGFATVRYAGKCSRPVRTHQATFEGLHVTSLLRCRRCPDCLRARMWYWALAGTHETEKAQEKGGRTWFGTLTFSPEAQDMLVRRAREKWVDALTHDDPDDSWWSDSLCDERFRLVYAEVRLEIQRYWKRLRKAGHKLRYLVVIERHKSGLPHVHWLVHEDGAPIRKRQLQEHWPHGFTKIVLVGGRAKRSAGPKQAAFYVVKYLQKSVQARQMASQAYRPPRRGNSLS